MKTKLDERGKACPLPVIETKKQLEHMSVGDCVEVIVDNEIAVQNLTKFAKQKKYPAQAEKIEEKVFAITITVAEGSSDVPIQETEEVQCIPNGIQKGELVAISTGVMGGGDDELGKALLKAFLFALTKQDTYPETILLYNGGAFVSCEGSESLEDLKFLEAHGSEILTCGTCLNFYGIGDKLAVGDVTNMYDIVERMEKADKIIRP